MNDWYILTDPRTKQKCVSFTLLVVTFIVTLVAQGMYMYGKLQNSGQLVEIFYSTCALYFGTNSTFGSKVFSSQKADEISDKVNQIIEQQKVKNNE